MTTAAPAVPELHPLVLAAARGELPAWAGAGPARRAHMDRVAALLDGWSEALALPEGERLRWRALAYLHDCLKEAPEAELRLALAPPLRNLPGPVLHGPAAASRLEAAGVRDDELLDAVRFHTLGSPILGTAGKALYAADFLDPGRVGLADAWRGELRARMPRQLDEVVGEIVARRIAHLLERGRPVRAETLAFRRSLAAGEGRG